MNARRRFYAEEIAAVAGLDDARLVDAFARVEREAFLGPGPWDVVTFGEGGAPRYRRTPDGDPAHVCHNVVVALDASRNLNNGQPSAVASWIAALRLKPPDEALHVGCGTGYYTAILAAMAARVDAIEIDAALAGKARANLVGSRAQMVDSPRGQYDAILINAGATHPRAEWLDALRPGGRLAVPLTVAIPGNLHGGGLMLEVCGESARFSTPVSIYPCEGARDPAVEPVLKAALFGGGWREVRCLRRETHDAGPSCVVHTAEACLSR